MRKKQKINKKFPKSGSLQLPINTSSTFSLQHPHSKPNIPHRLNSSSSSTLEHTHHHQPLLIILTPPSTPVSPILCHYSGPLETSNPSLLASTNYSLFNPNSLIKPLLCLQFINNYSMIAPSGSSDLCFPSSVHHLQPPLLCPSLFQSNKTRYSLKYR